MRKVICLFFISLFITTLTSCTADADDTIQDKLVKKIIEVNQDESSSTYIFTYNGKKIISIESQETSKTFFYTGDLITKIVALNKTTQTQSTSDYIYTNNHLTKVINSDNYTFTYTHQPNGSITYQKTTTDSNNAVTILFDGSLSLTASNIIKDMRTLATRDANKIYTEEVSFGYEAKKNPFHSITGFSKLLDHSKMISINNVKTILENNTITIVDTNQITSSANYYSNSFVYDNDGYIKELISEKAVLGNQNKNHFKSLFFY